MDDIIDKLEISALPTFAFYNKNKLIEIISGGNPISLKLKTEKLAKLRDKSVDLNETAKTLKMTADVEDSKVSVNNNLMEREMLDVNKAKDYIKLTQSGKAIAYFQADWYVYLFVKNLF